MQLLQIGLQTQRQTALLGQLRGEMRTALQGRADQSILDPPPTSAAHKLITRQCPYWPPRDPRRPTGGPAYTCITGMIPRPAKPGLSFYLVPPQENIP
jgi:hypothetical protein